MTNLHVIVGIGATGFSCARYLKHAGIPFVIMDTRLAPPYLAQLQEACPDVKPILGPLDQTILMQAAKIIVSPGVSQNEPTLKACRNHGIPLIGDIELFAGAVNARVIAITGTNAKSTVTTLVGSMLQRAAYHVAVGGNLGTPALNLLLSDQPIDVFVLELSSFQLETTFSLQTEIGSILNVTPDHLDRYPDFKAYHEAKLRIYQHCKYAICNRDDPLTHPPRNPLQKNFYFSQFEPTHDEFGLIKKGKTNYLAYGDQCLLTTDELGMRGKQAACNGLAALAIGHAFGMNFNAMLEELRSFQGLPHRCQLVRELHQVKWFNDSKGTNVGATIAAIEGIGSETRGKLIIIAGGVGKQADFSLLVPVFKKYVRHTMLIGEAANDLALVLQNHVPLSFAASLEEAVQKAQTIAEIQDSVLLSPACASFDMFKNFEHRGEVFIAAVNDLR